MNIEQRFFVKVQVDQSTSCWIWKASRDRFGYGLFDNRVAHRFGYELIKGKIPKGLELDHLCRNRSCVNPDHLEPVTHIVNIQRGNSGLKDRIKTHCPHNHEYNKKNTVHTKRGRACRTCKNIATSRSMKKLRKERSCITTT